MVLAQRGNTPSSRLARLTRRRRPIVVKSLRVLQRSGLVGQDEKRRWVIDRRHPAARELRLLMARLGALHNRNYASAENYEPLPAVSPFPDLDAVAPAELDNGARTRVLLYIASTEPCSILEIAEAVGVTFGTAYRIVHHFRGTGILDALMSPGGRTVDGVRLTQRHPLAADLRKLLTSLVRHVHPEFAALKESRRHRRQLHWRLRINDAARAAGIERDDWNAVPYRARR